MKVINIKVIKILQKRSNFDISLLGVRIFPALLGGDGSLM